MKNPRRAQAKDRTGGTTALDEEVAGILKDIEAEETPQRLLELARRLQEALRARQR